MNNIKKYLNKRRHDQPDIRIGKQGIHNQIITTANHLLKKRKGAIKIKILKNIAPTKQDAKKIAQELAKKIQANYIKIIGRTAIIAQTKTTNNKKPPHTT